MKLSAPPPPPPPPPEQPAPDEQPNANNLNTGATTPEVPPPEPPAPTPAPKLLRWPAWYSGVDSTLAALVLLFAFATASFVARNSDVWLHLATGKRLFAGQYTPGSDPFSYSATDRAWVNHSWLLDGVAYLFYGGQGKVLIVVKAIIVALAFGLLIAIRRPRFSLWPWAAVACVAVLASAPYFSLRPQVVSMLFLAVTLYLLFRMPQKPNSWRFPIAIGITFWFWANSDPWFFVGPLALALILVGELIQTKLLKTLEEPTPTQGAASPGSPEEEEPLGAFPDVLTLAKALGIGVLACMLNPHHFRVWELPFELTGAPGVEVDPRLRQLLLSSTDSDFYTHAGLGQNVNGVAYAVLFVAGAAVLGFGYGRIRVSHIALWLGFAGLSLYRVYAIPFFAIIAVPLVAAQLNSISQWRRARAWMIVGIASVAGPILLGVLIGLALKRRGAFEDRGPLADEASPDQIEMFLSSLGRILCVLGVCALCVLAYPGWVHPETTNPAYARRVAWGVEPDPSLQQAAEQFKQWRESGQLPPDARGMITNVDLANYVAWFAPQEKVFLNARYNHHRRELPDYIAVRKGLGLIGSKEDRPNVKDATDVLKKANAEFVAIHAGPADTQSMRIRASETTSALYQQGNNWSPWYVDGRTVVFGWHPAGEAAKPTFVALRVDPVALAFGPGVVRVPEPELKQPLTPLDWEEPFVRPAKPAPIGGSEALGWLQFKEGPELRQLRRQLIRERLATPFFGGTPGIANPTMHQLAMFYAQAHGVLHFAPNERTDLRAAKDAAMLQACPILALRAVRRAIAEDPDHPDSYFALAQVLRDSDLPLTEGERALGIVTAYQQCLARFPKPERYKRGQFMADPTEIALQLANIHLGPRIPGPIDPKTKQDTARGFIGMPIDLAPFGEFLGQAVFENRGELIRVPIAELRMGRVQMPQSARLLTGNTPCFLSLDTARDLLKLALAYAPVDLGGEPTDAYKKRVEGIEKLLKDVETVMVRANDQYNQVKGRKLPILVEAARHNGLTEEALRLLTDKDTNLAKEYGEAEGRAVLLRIVLEFGLGHIENTSELLAALSTPEQTTVLNRTGLTAAVQMLKYQKCLQAGEYKTAGEVWESLGGRSIGVEPLLSAIARNKVVPNDMLFGLVSEWPPAFPGGGLWPAMLSHLVSLDRSGRAFAARSQILEHLQSEASYFYRRGLLALLEGDIPTAKRWFLQTNRKSPPGWNLPDVGHADARRFLQLIEMAEKKPAP